MAASRLQLASRIHFSLRRSLNIHVDVSEMLLKENYAEEILMVCRGMATDDLLRLADQFEQASREQRSLRRAPGQRPRDLAHHEVLIRRPNALPRAAKEGATTPQATLQTAGEAQKAPARRAPVSLSQLAADVRERLQGDATAGSWWPLPFRRLAEV